MLDQPWRGAGQTCALTSFLTCPPVLTSNQWTEPERFILVLPENSICQTAIAQQKGQHFTFWTLNFNHCLRWTEFKRFSSQSPEVMERGIGHWIRNENPASGSRIFFTLIHPHVLPYPHRNSEKICSINRSLVSTYYMSDICWKHSWSLLVIYFENDTIILLLFLITKVEHVHWKKDQTTHKYMEMKGPLSQSPRIATVNNWYNSSIILHSILQFALFIQQATPSFHISICTVISIFSTPSKFSVLCTYLTLYNLPFLILMDIEVISTLLVYK